jgi:hypothetical protein
MTFTFSGPLLNRSCRNASTGVWSNVLASTEVTRRQDAERRAERSSEVHDVLTETLGTGPSSFCLSESPIRKRPQSETAASSRGVQILLHLVLQHSGIYV